MSLDYNKIVEQNWYYLGPWQKDSYGVWVGPSDQYTAIDLRPASGEHNLGIFRTSKPVKDSSYVRLGSLSGELSADMVRLTSRERRRWCHALGIKSQIVGSTLAEVLAHTLTVSVDAHGDGAVRPLTPNHTGEICLYFGDLKPIWQHKIKKDPTKLWFWSQLQAIYQSDYKSAFNLSQELIGEYGQSLFRRVLGGLSRKLQLTDEVAMKLLTPNGVPLLLPHAPQTIINDTFDRADQSGLGTSSQGTWSWVYSGASSSNWEIASNEAAYIGTSALPAVAIADAPLSTSDIYTECSLMTSSGNGQPKLVGARNTRSQTGYYCGHYDVGNNFILTKFVNSAWTTLGTGGINDFRTATAIGCEANGSAIRGYEPGVGTKIAPISDTSITSGLYSAIASWAGGTGSFADFDAGDFTGPDITDPTVQSAVINTNGDTLTITYDENCTGQLGFTITPSGGSATLSPSSGDGTNTHVFSISRSIESGETVTFDYSAITGNVEDTSGNTLGGITDGAVTNNSTFTPDIVAPELTSATITEAGNVLVLVFDEIVQNYTGFSISMSGGAVTLSNPSGSGTDTLSFDLSRSVLPNETGTIDYTPGDVEDLSGNTLVAISGDTVTNNSLIGITFDGNPFVDITAIDASGGIASSRTTGYTPAFIQVSASNITATGSTRPYEDLVFEWDFGESGAELFTNPTTNEVMDAGTDQKGPEAAYVYRSAGVYTVTLTIKDPKNAGLTETVTETITVTQHTPSQTVYFDSVNGDNANDGSTPETAKQSFTDPIIQTDVVYSFARGGDYNIPHIQEWRDRQRIVAHGTGARPILRCNGYDGFYLNRSNIHDFVFSGLEFRQGNAGHIVYVNAGSGVSNIYFDDCLITPNPEGSATNVLSFHLFGPVSNFGLWRCKTDMGDTITSGEYLGSLGSGGHWRFMIGVEMSGGVGDATLKGRATGHNVYTGDEDHQVYRWCAFGTGRPVDRLSNVHINSDYNPSQYVLVDSCHMRAHWMWFQLKTNQSSYPEDVIFSHNLMTEILPYVSAPQYDNPAGGTGYMKAGNRFTFRDNQVERGQWVFAWVEPDFSARLYGNRLSSGTLMNLPSGTGDKFAAANYEMTAPTVLSATINSAGNRYTIVYNEPITGQGGQTLDASSGEVSLTPLSGNGTDTHVWALSRNIGRNEIVTRSYSPGYVFGNIALGDSGNVLPVYDEEAVTNNSTVIADPTDIASLTLWCDAETLTETISDGGAVQTWTKAGGSESFSPTQATVGNRPTLSHGAIGERAAINFTAANSQFMEVGTAADTQYLHDGSGCSGYFVFTVKGGTLGQPDSLNVLFDSLAGSSGNRGISIYHDDRSSVPRDHHLNMFTSNGGTGRGVLLDPISAQQCVAQTVYVLAWRWEHGIAGNDFQITLNETQIDAGDGLDGTAAAHTNTPVLGRLAGTSLYADLLMAEFGLFDERLSDADFADLHDYLRAKYGKVLVYKGDDQPTGTLTTIVNTANDVSFPSATFKADNSTVYLVYREGAAHTGTDGVIKRVTCNADGTSVSSATTLHDVAGVDPRDPNTILLASGKRLLIYAETDAGLTTFETKAQVSALDDDSYGSAVTVTTAWDTVEFGASAPLQLSNGRILVAVYGRDSAETKYSAAISYSDDDGATWATLSEIADGESDGLSYAEPCIAQMSDGTILCLIRELDNNIIMRSTSADSGATWSSPVFCFLGSGRPMFRVMQPASGNDIIVCPYRSTLLTTTSGFEESVFRYSIDQGVTWSDELLLNAANVRQFFYADILDDDGDVYVFWARNVGGSDVDIAHRLLFTYDATDTIDATKPTVQSATINSTGTQYTIVYSEAVTGQTGHTLSATGGAVTLTPSSGDTTDTHVWDLSRTITTGETVTRSYAPGNAEDAAGNTLDAYSGQAVTNNSTVPDPDLTAPMVSSASINTAGTLYTIVYDEAVTGQTGHTLGATGGAVTLTPSSGDGTNTHVWSLSRIIGKTETVTRSYSPGDAEDSSGNALAIYNEQSVTNNSNSRLSFNANLSLGSNTNINLLAWWAMQEANGTTIDNTNGNAFGDLSTHNMGSDPETETGPTNYLTSAIRFRSANSEYMSSNWSNLVRNPQAGYTFLTWINPKSFTTSDSFSTTNPQYIFTAGTTGSVESSSAMLRVLGGKLDFTYRNSSNTEFVTQRADSHIISNDSWQLIGVRHTGSQIDLIHNASVIASTLISGDPSDAAISSPDNVIIFGQQSLNAQRYLDAALAMPMFFNTSLTNSDLLDIYNGPELINTVAPSITGLVIIGETITCDFGTWILPSPFTGTNGTVSYEYQWYRSDDDIGTNEVPIVGETNSTYTLVVDDTSKHLRCKVRAINSFGGYDSNADTYSNFISIGSGISYAKRFEPWISEAPVSGTITSGWYVGSPNLVVAEDGTYWACHDEFQPGTVQNTRIYKSLDSGATWSYVRVINNSAWPTLFEYNDTLYILSCSAQYGDLVLHYSSDDWATFNTLTISSGNYHKAQNAWIEKDGYLFFAVEDVQSPTPAWGTDFLAQIWYVDINDLTNLSNWRSSNTVAYNTSWGELDWGANSTPEGWLEGNVLETQGGDIVVMYRHSNNVDDVAAYLTTTWNSVTPSLSLAFNDSTGFVDFPGGHVKFWPVYDTATDRWFALTNYDPHSMTESDMITTDPNNRQSLRQSLWLISAPTLNGSWSIHAQILRDEIENTTDDIFSLTGWQYITPVWDGNLLRFTSRTGYNGANSEHNANRLTYHEVPNISETINASRSALEYANSTWNYSAEFIIESGKVATDQNNFTVRVDLSQIYDDDFWNSVMLDGGDIRVTDDTNTEVPSWIDPNNFCQQSRTGIVFAKINYSAASGATLRVKAGNSSASAYSDTDTFGKNNVFDSNVTTAFWHGKRLSSNASSNTGNMNDGSTGFHRGDDNYLMWGGSSTSAGAPASISHYSDLSLDLSNNNTIEVVVEPTDLSGGDTFNATNPATIIQKGGAPDYILRLLGDKLDFTFRDSSNTGFLGFRSESGVITATRQHISITTDGISVKAFIDGVEINFPQEEAGGGNYPDNGLQTTDDLHVAGRQGDGLRKLRGGVDGIRFHNIVRSNDWLSLSAQQDKNILEFSLLNNVGPDVDTTSPTVSSATINSLGTQYTIVYSEAVTGQTGHTLSATGGAVTLTPLSGNGTDTHIWTLSRTISSGETVTRSYTPGNAVDGSDNALEAYSGQSVTNGSGYPPPSTTSAFVTTAGNILTLGFSENVTGQSGWTLNASGVLLIFPAIPEMEQLPTHLHYQELLILLRL
jgi:hypothetical protein